MARTEPDRNHHDNPTRQRDAMPTARYVFTVLAICFSLVGLATVSLIDRQAGAAGKVEAGRRTPATSTTPGRTAEAGPGDRPCDQDERREAPAPYFPPDP